MRAGRSFETAFPAVFAIFGSPVGALGSGFAVLGSPVGALGSGFAVLGSPVGALGSGFAVLGWRVAVLGSCIPAFGSGRALGSAGRSETFSMLDGACGLLDHHAAATE